LILQLLQRHLGLPAILTEEMRARLSDLKQEFVPMKNDGARIETRAN